MLTDLWPSVSEPFSGSFVQAQVRALDDRFRQLVLVPKLLLPRAHARVWGRGVPGWQEGWQEPVSSARLLRYPILRLPKVGEAETRVLGARRTLAQADESPVLVHGHFLHEVGVTAVRLGRALGVPAVVSVHGTDARWVLEGGIQPRHVRRMLAAACAADRLLVVERGLAERLVAAGVHPERVLVLPMGADETLFRPRSREDARAELGLPPDGRIVLFVGRPSREKGFDVLDAALASVDATCVAVGSVGTSERVRFAGPQEPAGVARWLAAADLLCLPSHAEGMPVSVVEALACGRPVVASAVGGIPEQLSHGDVGLLVPPGDVGALAEGLRSALERDWDEVAIRAASEPFWWSGLARRLAAVYEELL